MSTINRHFALALGQLKGGVVVCCWLIGLALAVQVVMWSLLTFMDLRWEHLEVGRDEAATTVVTPEARRSAAVRNFAPDGTSVETLDVNRQTTTTDRIMRTSTNLFAAVGTMAGCALLPFIGLGVMLAGAARTDGIERTTGAFVWSVVLLTLVLPWGRFFDAVPFAGLLPSYASITADVDFWRFGAESGAEASVTSTGLLFWARYLVLPLGCLAGIAAIGLRFAAGVRAGLIPRESLRLDPELEGEIARIRAGSNVGGGRTAGALHSAFQPSTSAAVPPEANRSVRQVSPGEVPRRLI